MRTSLDSGSQWQNPPGTKMSSRAIVRLLNMRTTLACQWCRSSKIKCQHNGTAPCWACASRPGRECVLSRPGRQNKPLHASQRTCQRLRSGFRSRPRWRARCAATCWSSGISRPSVKYYAKSSWHWRTSRISRSIWESLIRDCSWNCSDRDSDIHPTIHHVQLLAWTYAIWRYPWKGWIGYSILWHTCIMCTVYPSLGRPTWWSMCCIWLFRKLSSPVYNVWDGCEWRYCTVQTLLLLSFHDWGCCKSSQAWMYNGTMYLP